MKNRRIGRAAVLLADGFEEIEAVTPVDVLRRAGVEVVLVGISGLSVKGSRGVVYAADEFIADLGGEFGLVALPGGMPGAKNLGESAEARSLAEKTAAAGGLVAAICAAPAMALAPWGLLDGKRATCYPGFEKHFSSRTAFSPERVVVDGNIVTSRGPGTALEFSLRLVELASGEEAMRRLSVDMLAR